MAQTPKNSLEVHFCGPNAVATRSPPNFGRIFDPIMVTDDHRWHPWSSSQPRLEVERAQIFRARICPNYPRACFKHELVTNRNAKIRVWAYFEPYRNIGLSSLEPGAHLLWAKNWARAYEPEPSLVPPLGPPPASFVVGRRSWKVKLLPTSSKFFCRNRSVFNERWVTSSSRPS